MIQLAPSLKIFMAACTSYCANCYYMTFVPCMISSKDDFFSILEDLT